MSPPRRPVREQVAAFDFVVCVAFGPDDRRPRHAAGHTGRDFRIEKVAMHDEGDRFGERGGHSFNLQRWARGWTTIPSADVAVGDFAQATLTRVETSLRILRRTRFTVLTIFASRPSGKACCQ